MAWAACSLIAMLALGCETSNSEAVESRSDELKNGEIPAYGVQYAGPDARAVTASGVTVDDAKLSALADIQLRLPRVSFIFSESWRQDSIPSIEHLDKLVLKAAAGGGVVLPGVIKTEQGRPAQLTPADHDYWRRFLQTLAVRYGPRGFMIGPEGQPIETGTLWRDNPSVPMRPIQAWEIWNEPNLSTFWVDRANYRQTLRLSKEALRRVNPKARIIFGGLWMPTKKLDKALDYIDAVSNDGGKCLFDAVAIHPYANTAKKAFAVVRETREHLDKRGLKTRGLWMTEIGWAVANDSFTAKDPPFTVKSERTRGARIEAFAKLVEGKRKAWRLGPTIWYTINDLRYKPDWQTAWDHHAGFFAVQPDGSLIVDESGKMLGERRSWRKSVGKVARKHRTAKLPPVHLCSWEKSAKNPDQACGCSFKCGQNEITFQVPDEATCAKADPYIYCGDLPVEGYRYVPCGG
jgi:hypothetical protein